MMCGDDHRDTVPLLRLMRTQAPGRPGVAGRRSCAVCADHAQHRSLDRDCVELALRVHAERGQARHAGLLEPDVQPMRLLAAGSSIEAPDGAATAVTVDVAPAQADRPRHRRGERPRRARARTGATRRLRGARGSAVPAPRRRAERHLRLGSAPAAAARARRGAAAPGRSRRVLRQPLSTRALWWPATAHCRRTRVGARSVARAPRRAVRVAGLQPAPGNWSRRRRRLATRPARS